MQKVLPRQGKTKVVHHHQTITYEMLKGLKKNKIKTMNIKMAIHSQPSTIESKKQTKQTSRTERES